jgi:hypothetical protein
VFLVHPREVIERQYERDPGDPRVNHQLTLRTDEYGNVLESATVGYGRLRPDPELPADDQATQSETLITCSESQFTNAVDDAAHFRTPSRWEQRGYQLTGLAPPPGEARFGVEDLLTAIAAARTVEYEQTAPAGGLGKRPIEHVRTLYRPDDLGSAANDPLALLPGGVLQPLALPGESYTLALTPGLLASVYVRDRDGRAPEDLLPDPAAVV